jgi:serine/threonine protein kinase
MHSKGIYHSDLHLKNILISYKDSTSAKKIYIIDFDKAILKATLSPREKINNLLRFNRSLEKYKLQGGLINRTDQCRLLKEYFSYDRQAFKFYNKFKYFYFGAMKLRRFKWDLFGVSSKMNRTQPKQAE